MNSYWEVFKISLEEVTGKQYSELRREFLKGARKHYNTELWNGWEGGYLKALAATGMVIGSAGIVATYFSDSPWCIVPLGVGAMNMVQAGVKKRHALKETMNAVEKRTAGITGDELEMRIGKGDYSLPEPTREDMQNFEMGLYAVTVAQAVAEKDFKFMKYPWPSVGVGLLAYGAYSGFTDNPVAGGMTMTMGGVVLLVSNYLKKRKIAKIAEHTHEFLKQKGYGYFDSYIRKKEPYEFYERFMKAKQAQKSDAK